MIEDYDNVDFDYTNEWDLEQAKKEITRLNNIIAKALEIIEPEISFSFKGDELFLMPDQLKELLKILKEGK